MTSAPGIDPTVPPSGEGCTECDASGGWWFHLRRCAQCGHIGCCDSSPAQHARAHAAATGHRIIRSFEPGEEWGWCYVDELFFERAPVAARTAPGTPRARGRVPADWQRHLH